MKPIVHRTFLVRSTAWIVFATIYALPQISSAQIYRWTDESGKVVVSDTPPPSGVAKKISKGGGNQPKEPTPSPAAQKNPGDAAAAKKTRDAEAQEKAAEERRQKAVAEYCESAGQRLAQLQSGERLMLRDKSGERSFMTDQQRADELAKLREGMLEQKCP